MFACVYGRFDERLHPRNPQTGRFLPANNPTPDPAVVVRLREQAETSAKFPETGDRTDWREQTRRVQARIDALFESFDEGTFADEIVRPDGHSYLAPSQLVHDLEVNIRRIGEIVDTEIHARIGDPAALHDAEDREAQAVLKALQLRSVTFHDTENTPGTRIGRQLSAEVSAADAEVRVTGADRERTQADYTTRYHQELQAILHELRPMGGSIDMSGDSRSAAAVSAVADGFPSEWIEASNESDVPLQVSTGIGERSGYRIDTGQLVIGLPANGSDTHQPDDGQAQAAHELVHRFEASDPSIRMLEWGFFHRRITSAPGATHGQPEEPEPLADLTGQPGYEDELCCPDHFTNPYIGRVYEPGSPFSPFEVLAVGVESLRTGDNGIHDDPDWRTFTVGMLAGG